MANDKKSYVGTVLVVHDLDTDCVELQSLPEDLGALRMNRTGKNKPRLLLLNTAPVNVEIEIKDVDSASDPKKGVFKDIDENGKVFTLASGASETIELLTKIKGGMSSGGKVYWKGAKVKLKSIGGGKKECPLAISPLFPPDIVVEC